MKKVINVILTLLIIAAIVVIGLIIYNYVVSEQNDNNLAEVVTEIEQQFSNNTNTVEPVNIQYNGFDVVGIIEIPSINIKYPIINKTNDTTMKYSITKFSGGEINSIGNFTVAGHNNLNGTMFGKVKRLKIGDQIKLTDLYNNTVTYEIFDIYSVDPNDVSCLDSVEENTKEVTLITCTNGHLKRLITKAREVV